jgi:hypothetical protein
LIQVKDPRFKMLMATVTAEVDLYLGIAGEFLKAVRR